MAYAFREALAQIVEEGLDLYKLRHAENAQRLREGLQNIGLELFVENPEQRLPSITSIRIPHGIKMDTVIKCMQERYVYLHVYVHVALFAPHVLCSLFCVYRKCDLTLT